MGTISEPEARARNSRSDAYGMAPIVTEDLNRSTVSAHTPRPGPTWQQRTSVPRTAGVATENRAGCGPCVQRLAFRVTVSSSVEAIEGARPDAIGSISPGLLLQRARYSATIDSCAPGPDERAKEAVAGSDTRSTHGASTGQIYRTRVGVCTAVHPRERWRFRCRFTTRADASWRPLHENVTCA